MKTLFLATLAIIAASPAQAQSGGPWSITSSTIDGGGGASTGGAWKLTGTIGQADATVPISIGGTYAEAGGFWPGVSAMPTGPALMLTPIGSNQIKVAWTAASVGYKLQYSENLLTWTDYSNVITGAASMNFSLGNGPRYFFRLKQL